MDFTTSRNRLVATVAASALIAGAAGIMLGRNMLAQPPAAESAAASPEAEAGHSAEGFVAMTAARAAAAGIVTEMAHSGGFGAEIIAQGLVSPTPEGEAVLTARADGAIVRINRRLGDAVRTGETVAVMESRDAGTIAGDRASAAARAVAARAAFAREKRLFDAKVTARQDFEGAQATLATAEADLRRAQSAAGAAKVSGDGRTLAVVSLVSGRVTKADAKLGAYVLAGTELFRVADPRRVQVNASVLAADAKRIQPGDTALIELPDGTTRTATVRSATPGLDPESRAATVLLVPSGTGELTPGQGLRVRIKPRGAVAGSSIALPEEAVQTFEGREVVFVRTAKGFQAANVTTGQRGGGRIEVVAGLTGGTAVATRGAFLLKAELGKGEAEH